MNRLARLGELWHSVQTWLFPSLEDELGELDEKHREFVAVCETCAPQVHMAGYRWVGNGCPPSDRLDLCKAFIAKAVWDFPTTRALIDAIRYRPTLRRLCGWETVGEIPSAGLRLGLQEKQSGQGRVLARLQVAPRQHRRRPPGQLARHLGQHARQPGGHPTGADECRTRHEPLRPVRRRLRCRA